MVQLDQQIEVKVLRVHTQRERIALGLKQKQRSPWRASQRYPVAAPGRAVNIMSYGAFVKLRGRRRGTGNISR